MEIKEIKDRKMWNDFLLSFGDYTFLQSWQWGEINDGEGEENVYRLAAYKGKTVMGIVQAFTITAKRGKMLFVPHGPLTNNKSVWHFLIRELKKIAIENRCVCLRVSPWELKNENNLGKYLKYGFRKSGVIMHAEDTWLVDLRGSEEELMSRMRKTTRNLIRRGEREGIKIWMSNKLSDVNYLYKLQLEVVKRNGFVPFSKEYLRKELEILSRRNMSVMFLGEGSEGVVGAALIVFLGKYAFYYQSGSKTSKEPVNYLLQWEVIKEARRRGCEIYNMWGVAPISVKNHPWQGLTMFKMGFGGEMKEYLESVDYPVKWLGYMRLKLFEKIPKTWRSVLTKIVK